MKTLIQNYSSGKISIEELPFPTIREDEVLVETYYSAVSLGTEMSMVNLAKKNLLQKAISRPDLVKKVIDKVKQTSLTEAIKMSLNKLDSPIPLGYSASGKVIDVGKNIKNFKKGDFVAAVGSNLASHSEYIVLPEIMLAQTTQENLKESSFGMLGCISMHACRLCNLQLGGASIGVLGSGILGNLCSQILKAYGSNVVSYDPNIFKANELNNLKINSFSDEEKFKSFVNSSVTRGLDSVIIACNVNDNKPLLDALEIVKPNGTIIILGNLDISIDRQLMWEKQVSIRVSKAGGFGALEDSYENKGIDYPEDIIKWTQERNLIEFIRLIDAKLIDVKNIITREESFSKATELYENLVKGINKDDLGIVFSYPNDVTKSEKKNLQNLPGSIFSKQETNLGVIGAGNHAVMTFLPALKKIKGVGLKTLVSKTSVKANHISKKFSFNNCSTNKEDIFSDEEITHVISLERHSDHLETIKKSILSKKNLLIEKPLCTSRKELDEIKKLINEINQLPLILVGHNRRYSQIIKELIKKIDYQSPMMINVSINAGKIDKDHWLYSKEEGGNRIISECSHFIDMIKFISKSKINKISANGLGSSEVKFENFSSTFSHDDGSVSSLMYFSEGSRSAPREIFEVIQNGKLIRVVDFKLIESFEKKSNRKKYSYDLGFQNQINHFLFNANKIDFKENFLDELETMDLTLSLFEKIST